MFQGMEYVYAVYKEKSFSVAAQNLFISQPSLSATVKRIESKLGYPIFDRSTKPLSLTEYGEKYIQFAEEIMAAEKEFQDYINDCGDLKVGKLSIGGTSLFSSWVLPPLMGQFNQKYPNIKVELVEESSANLELLLQEGKIDLMLDNTVLDSETFEHHLFHSEHLLLAVPKSLLPGFDYQNYIVPVERIIDGTFIETDIPAVPLKEFLDAPFIMLKQENDTRKRAMEVFHEASFVPHIKFELDQQLTSYNVSCSGLGISFISDTLISKVPIHPDIVYFKPSSNCCHRNLYFYYKARRYFSGAMKAFLELTGYSEE